MRRLVIVLATVIGAVPAAHATPAADLQAKGQQFAKDGRFSDAIDAFKAADRLEPRAANACLIALAYTRRELWPQAEMFLHLCHVRATADDPLPDWVPAADTQIAARLATANVALVEIVVAPDMPVKLTVSSFALDEALSQRTIHLPYGHNVILASADGYDTERQEIEIVDRSKQQVTITMHKTVPKPVATVGVQKPAPTQPSASRLPWYVSGAGGVLLVGGLATDLAWAQPLRDKLKSAPNLAAYNMSSGSFDTARNVTYGMYGVGAAAAIAGVILHYTVFRGPADTQMRITGDTINGGAVIQLEWTR